MNDEVGASPLHDAHQGGDPVWSLHLVCPHCGRMADSVPPATCAGCGLDIPPVPGHTLAR